MVPGPSSVPDGVTVDGADWLPSGARSGIVRVHGRRPPDAEVVLPQLLLVGPDGAESVFASLPDTAAAGPDGWRGAYVVTAAAALSATAMRLRWPSGEVAALGPLAPPADQPRLAVVAPAPVEGAPEAPASGAAAASSGPATSDPARPAGPGAPQSGGEAPGPLGGEVVERAVLAERRAAKAERAAEAQAAAASDALAAVEALELRSAALARDLSAAHAERDALRARVEPAEPAPPSPRETALERALADRQTEVDALRAAAVDPPAPDVEAERRAAVLTQALTESVAEVERLQTELQEQLLLRRTRDLAAGADRVALVALVQDLDDLRRAAEAARAEAAVLLQERDEARVLLERQRAETAGALAAHTETRTRFTERVAELRDARERIAGLEAELAALRGDADRVAEAHAAELAAARAAAEAEARAAADRLAAAQAEAARLAEGAREADRLRAQVTRLETRVREAETAREVALASALAARAQRQAAAVASAPVSPEHVAALEAEVTRLRAALALGDAAARSRGGAPTVADAPPAAPAVPGPVPAPDDVIARAAEQVRAAAQRPRPPAETAGRLVADLEAAAAALRARTPAPDAAPAPDPEPAAPAVPHVRQPAGDEGAAPAAQRTRRAITTEVADLPGDLARGRGGRTYPALRGGVVKLAHDDPRAAAELLAGLAGGLHALHPDPVRIDLTLAELEGTLAIDVADRRTTAERRSAPRGRREVDVAITTDALTLAEALAGVGPKPRRRGPLRATRGRRRARALLARLAETAPTSPASPAPTAGEALPALVAAGARVAPRTALRAFAYAVPRAWTAGHAFTAAVVVGDARTTLRVGDGTGVHVNGDVDEPDTTLVLDAEGFGALLAGSLDGAATDARLGALQDWARALGALPA